MIIVLPILTVLFFLTIILITVLRFHATKFSRQEEILREVFWGRLHKIPLLLELFDRAGAKIPERAKIIEIRSKLMSEAFSLEEKVGIQRELSKQLDSLFQMAEVTESLRTDGLIAALKKELNEDLAAIRIALNDYNFLVQKMGSFVRFTSKMGKSKPLELL